MVKNKNGFKLTGKVTHTCIIKVCQFSGAKTSCIKDYIKSIIREKNPEQIVSHIGTNDLNSSKTPAEIAEEIVDLANSFKTDNNSISISSLVPRPNNLNNKAEEINGSFKKMCGASSLRSINYYPSIKPNQHRSKLHFNRKGNSIFEKNFEKFLFSY